jgi:hypothetical protein
MRKLFLSSLSAVGAFVLAGCTEGTPGGPGATRPEVRTSSHRQAEPVAPSTANEPVRRPTDTTPAPSDTVHRGDETFTLGVPTFSTTLKQGEAKEISIAAHRGKNFAEDVSLRFMDLPKGLTIEPENPMIRASEKDAKVMIKAAPDAPLGDFMIKVIGHPTRGADAMNELRVTIRKK